MDLREVGWEAVDWMHLIQDRDSGGLLWTYSWTLPFYRKRGIS